MRVFVTGATGAVGPVVVEALVAAGYAVRVFVRTTPPAGLLPPGVECVAGDILDRDAVRQAMRGCDLVIHMAALLHLVNPSPGLRRAYEQINVQGTDHVVQAALAHEVERLLFFSTIAVYGHGRREWLTEATPPQPDSLYGITKLAAEKLVLQARRATGEPLGTVLRVAAVYGTRVKGNYARLLEALAHGRFLPLGRGENRRTLIYDRDLAAAALLALRHPAAAGRIYNVTDGQTHSLREIIDRICQALQRTPPRVTIPIAPVRGLVGLLEDSLACVGRTSPVSRSLLDKYQEEIWVDGCRIERELGFRPYYTLAAGWQDVVRRRKQ